MKYDKFFTLADRKDRNRKLKDAFYRLGRRRQVKIIDPERLGAFLEALAGDAAIDLKSKVMVGLIACSGSRISEILDVRKNDTFESGGDLYFKIRVVKKDQAVVRQEAQLKKRGLAVPKWESVERKALVPKVIEPLLQEYLKRLKPRDRLFKLAESREIESAKMQELHGSWIKRNPQLKDQTLANFKKLRARDAERLKALQIVKDLFGSDMETHSFRHSYFSYLLFKKVPALEIHCIMEVHPDTTEKYTHITNLERKLKEIAI